MNANKRARTQAAPRAPRGVHNHSWARSHRATEAHAYTNPNPHQSVERRQSRHFRADCAEGRLVPHPRLVTWSVFVRTNVLRGRGKQGPAPPRHNTNPNPNQSVERRQSRHFRADCAEGWLVSEECGRGRQVRARAWAAVKRFGCDQLAATAAATPAPVMPVKTVA